MSKARRDRLSCMQCRPKGTVLVTVEPVNHEKAMTYGHVQSQPAAQARAAGLALAHRHARADGAGVRSRLAGRALYLQGLNDDFLQARASRAMRARSSCRRPAARSSIARGDVLA
jgi:hypothetical protein